MPSFEFLDILQHAKPGILSIDISKTAVSLRKAKGTINNYNLAIDPIPAYCSGLQQLGDLLAHLRTHPNPKWHPFLQEVGKRLFEVFDSRGGRWFPTGRRPIASVAGLYVKPAIRGVWVQDRKVHPCLINPRASVFLSSGDNLPFVSRGLHELHVRDDISATGPMVIDLGKDPKTGDRANRVHFPAESEMMSLEQFEDILRKFSEALILAGFRAHATKNVVDLFRPA